MTISEVYFLLQPSVSCIRAWYTGVNRALRHLDVLHFVDEECRHLGTVAQPNADESA